MTLGRRKAMERHVFIEGRQQFSGGHAEAVGKRPTMEDACAIIGEFAGPKTQFYAIFDGHGGSGTAVYCASTLPGIIADLYKSSGNMKEAIPAGLAKVNESATEQWRFTGATAAIVAIAEDHLYAANVGDTRVVLVEGGVSRRLSYDHKVSDESERQSIINRGGVIINGRVGGSLALTRSIGDGLYADSLSVEPFMVDTPLDPSNGLIIACDGVWDVMTDEDAAGLFNQTEDAGAAARLIKDEAMQRGSDDNVSVICVRLKPKE
jgi:serine/threonine protein phosphatase PrpC